jgi:hypothetical protein
MPALVAGIHVFLAASQQKGVDGRDKPGHDGGLLQPTRSDGLTAASGP